MVDFADSVTIVQTLVSLLNSLTFQLIIYRKIYLIKLGLTSLITGHYHKH